MKTTLTLDELLQRIRKLPRDKDTGDICEELDLLRDNVITEEEFKERVRQILGLNNN
mgnify:CR=1 FL=1